MSLRNLELRFQRGLPDIKPAGAALVAIRKPLPVGSEKWFRVARRALRLCRDLRDRFRVLFLSAGMLSLTWISVALSLHPKISFQADKHRNAWRSPGEQRRLNISTGHTVPVPSTIAREHSLKTHCCRYRSRVGFSGKPLKVTRYCCSGRAAAALTPPIWPLVSAVWVNVAGSGFVSVGVSSTTAALGLPG